MVTNPDRRFKINRKRLIDGAVIGLLVGIGAGICMVTVFPFQQGNGEIGFGEYYICCLSPWVMGGLLGGLFGGIISPKFGGSTKALVVSAILGVICVLITIIFVIFITVPTLLPR
jgi:hypothetical protein